MEHSRPITCHAASRPLFPSRQHLQASPALKAQRPRQGVCRVLAAKQGIHPKYFEEAKVICNGEEVLTTSGTKAEYTVEVWSGNHPFYQGASAATLREEGRVTAFNKRFQGLESSWGKAGDSSKGALKYEGAKKAKGKGKGKK